MVTRQTDAGSVNVSKHLIHKAMRDTGFVSR